MEPKITSDLQPQILWQDDSFAVLNKPAGLIVNNADSVKTSTVQDWAREQWGSAEAWQESLVSDIFAEREGMVHRLDKDTSGVLLWAKTATALENLLEQFQTRTVQKTYLALVHGRLPEMQGVVHAAIERNPQNRTKFTVTSEGRVSETAFFVKHEFSELTPARLKEIAGESGQEVSGVANTARMLYQGGFSLVELHPKTGRTHQIRVHMDYLHHPLVGDERYAGRKRARLDAIWCERQWLHAWKITFLHPVSGEEMKFEAPLPRDLQSSLSLLSPDFVL
jgi:23S rRNA pseudouridine1911/1915/1917 synthase